MNVNKKNIAQLQEWIANPTADLQKYQQVVRALKAQDLMFLMTSDDKIIAKIAWIEFGRRRTFANIEISLVQVGETIELTYEADAVPLTHTVTLDG